MTGTPLRLRLTVQRNGLPDARIVFVLTVNEDATIYKFLEQVNDTIPLESADWGLDDYVVELPSPSGTSFECLHYQPVAHLLEKDEEVLIRPLSSDELKKRRISGRHQISNDGKHLVDGVPFGRPRLRRPQYRPPVHISPRKRRRIGYSDEANDDLDTLDTSSGLYSTPHDLVVGRAIDDEEFSGDDNDYQEEASDDSSELDSDIDADELQLLQEEALSPSRQKLLEYPCDRGRAVSRGTREEDSALARRRGSSVRSVRFRALNTPGAGSNALEPGSDSSSSQEEDDHAPEAATDSADSLSSYYSVDSDTAPKSEPSGPVPSDSLDDTTKEKGDDSGPGGKGGAVSAPAMAVVPVVQKQEGKMRTKKRNARRRAKRAMERRSKEEGGAVVAGHNTSLDTTAASSAHVPTPDNDAAGGCETPAAGSGSNDAPDSSPITTDSPTGRRLRLDIGAGRRLLFGALGIRNPRAKTVQEDKNKSQTQTSKAAESEQASAQQLEPEPKPEQEPATNGATSGKSDASQDGSQNQQQQEAEGDDSIIDESWRERISYRAVECAGHDTGLSEPPFPFVQRWADRAEGQEDATPIGSRKRKASSDRPESVEPVVSRDEEDSTAADGHLHTNGHHHHRFVQPDLPALPQDISSLPTLAPGDAAPGMVITWKTWTLSSKTSWQPQVIDLTALVDEVRDDGAELRLTLAQRDQDYDKSEKVYDEETGERVYGRFEAPEMDDPAAEHEHDDGACRVIPFSDLLEPRVVRQSWDPDAAMPIKQ